jgi:predicted membrane-bound spermidine synthase
VKKKSFFEYLISFLLGFSWAIALLGAIFAFELLYPFGLITAIISAIFGSLVGVFLVLFLEVVNLQVLKHKELQNQSELLAKILNRLDEKVPDNR